MENLLFIAIVGLSLWTGGHLLQVRRLTLRYQEVRRRNNEQDRPSKG